jgi:signal transduction histidine kinase
MLLATLGAILAAVFIGRYIGRRFARPIIRLSEFAAEISARRWDEALPEADSAELEELTESLDSMRRQLAMSFHALEEERDIMKRFLQDASHQLRTPITALNTFLELLNSDLPEVVDKRQELVEDSRQQVEKLSRIISDLMELTRIESERTKELRVSCSLKDLGRKAWKGIQEKALRKHLFLDISGPSGVVLGDPHRLEMALSNILDNGVKWSPEGGRIRVRLTQDRKKCSIRISDQGPGISIEDQSRIFVSISHLLHLQKVQDSVWLL